MINKTLEIVKNACEDFYNKNYITKDIFLFIFDFNNILQNKMFGKIKYKIKKDIFSYITSEEHSEKNFYFSSFVFYFLIYNINKTVPKNKKIKDKSISERVLDLYYEGGIYNLYKVRDYFSLNYIEEKTSVWFYEVYKNISIPEYEKVLSLFLYYVFVV